MSELLGNFYDEKTTKLFELVINKLLKKKYQWFDRIIVNKLSYSKDQNYLGVDARLFADEDWVKNQWGKFYYSKPMPSGTEDDPILFEQLIGGELSKKVQDYFKDVFVFVTSEKTPKYMSWSWIEAIPVEMNDKNLQENISRIKEMMGLLTEEETKIQLYVRRRYYCIDDYITKLENGEGTIPIIRRHLDWMHYQIILTAFIRNNCGDENQYYDPRIHSKIMDVFGKRLHKWYEENIDI